ncbi:MAG TPA: hypothetical protein VJJ73_01525 [Candidatus Paceibacterota bacterium]
MPEGPDLDQINPYEEGDDDPLLLPQNQEVPLLQGLGLLSEDALGDDLELKTDIDHLPV